MDINHNIVYLPNMIIRSRIGQMKINSVKKAPMLTQKTTLLDQIVENGPVHNFVCFQTTSPSIATVDNLWKNN